LIIRCVGCGRLFESKRTRRMCGECKWRKAFHGYQVLGKDRMTGGEIGTMGNIRDIVLGIDFTSVPVHVISFDPATPTRSVEARDGKRFEVVDVTENGRRVSLSLSNKTLIRALVQISEPCKLKITRSGESYATKYTVEKV
jgi:hypothetical protein